MNYRALALAVLSTTIFIAVVIGVYLLLEGFLWSGMDFVSSLIGAFLGRVLVLEYENHTSNLRTVEGEVKGAL